MTKFLNLFRLLYESLVKLNEFSILAAMLLASVVLYSLNWHFSKVQNFQMILFIVITAPLMLPSVLFFPFAFIGGGYFEWVSRMYFSSVGATLIVLPLIVAIYLAETVMRGRGSVATPPLVVFGLQSLILILGATALTLETPDPQFKGLALVGIRAMKLTAFYITAPLQGAADPETTFIFQKFEETALSGLPVNLIGGLLAVASGAYAFARLSIYHEGERKLPPGGAIISPVYAGLIILSSTLLGQGALFVSPVMRGISESGVGMFLLVLALVFLVPRMGSRRRA